MPTPWPMSSGEYHHPEAFEKLKNRLEELDRAHKLNGNRLFYLATPPDIYPVIIEQLDQGRPGEKPQRKILDANHHRKAVRPRSGLGAKAESNRAQGIRRIAGLPHRSLPGQGYGAKPHGAAVWQRHFRAAVEPQLRGPRANHRGEKLWASSSARRFTKPRARRAT